MNYDANIIWWMCVGVEGGNSNVSYICKFDKLCI